jgi:hypothetical protein
MKIMLGFLSIGLIVGSAQAQAYTVLDDLKVNLGRIATEVRASEHSPQADVDTYNALSTILYGTIGNNLFPYALFSPSTINSQMLYTMANAAIPNAGRNVRMTPLYDSKAYFAWQELLVNRSAP